MPDPRVREIVRRHAYIQAGEVQTCLVFDRSKVIYRTEEAADRASIEFAQLRPNLRFESHFCGHCRFFHVRDKRKRNNNHRAPDKRKAADRHRKKWDKILERDGRACRVCGADGAHQVVRIVPRRSGGGGAQENLAAACSECVDAGANFEGYSLAERIAYTLAQRGLA